ncbi:MAG: DUF433 domain-containing protein [Brevundimonas sp.]|nr:DUF433 domain-containing protein [Brevundimonas sp.]
MKRPIVSSPEKLGGLPHIEGTSHTIAELQTCWRRPGVGAAEMRERFPELTEAELGAAVTYAEPQEPEHSFSAEISGPPRKRLHIYGEPGNWMFVREDIDANETGSAGWDVWEESFSAIIRYPLDQAHREVVWRNDRSGEIVDIYSLDLAEG